MLNYSQQTNHRILYLFVITFSSLFLLAINNSHAQFKKPGNKIDQLPRKYEIADTTDTIDWQHLNLTIDHHEQLIAKYPDHTFIPYIMFELAELYASKAQYEFKQSMKKYDEEITKYEKGEIFGEPILPRVSLKKVIEIGYKLLEKFPKTSSKMKLQQAKL